MLNEKDSMWVDLRHKHFADAIHDISQQARALMVPSRSVSGLLPGNADLLKLLTCCRLSRRVMTRGCFRSHAPRGNPILMTCASEVPPMQQSAPLLSVFTAPPISGLC